MDRVADRVKETTSTTGTGDITLLGAVTSFQSFNSAFGLNVKFYYCITDVNGTDVEVGSGHLSGTTTLVRDTVDWSIISGTPGTTKLTLSATGSTVFCTPTGEMFKDYTGKMLAFSMSAPMP